LTKSASMIVDVSDYLPDTFRSQGFSPSQRFDPINASWLCFAPHPSIGFRPSELFPYSQPLRLSTSIPLLPSSAVLSGLRPRNHRTLAPESFSDCTFDTLTGAFSTVQGRCSPGLSPLRGLPGGSRGSHPPLACLAGTKDTHRSMHLIPDCTSGSYDQSWDQLRRVAPASMRFFTSSESPLPSI